MYKPLTIGGLTRQPYPSSLMVDVHSYCNASCRTCPYRDLKNTLPMGFMEDGLFRRIIDEFADIRKAHKVRGHVTFCYMGELFVDPAIFDKISYVLAARLVLVVQTNAYLLTPEKTDELIRTGFRGKIYVSCHGITPSVYKNVMGLDAARTLRNIDYLISRYPRDLVQVRAIPHEWPLGEAVKVRRYWKERGVSVKLFLPNDRTGLLRGLSRWSWKYPGEKLRGCWKGLPMRDMVVAYNGDAVLCCEDMARKVTLGNVKESSIQEVWNSPRAVEVLEKIYMGRPSAEDFICKTCEFGRSTELRRLAKNVDNAVYRLIRCTL